MFLATRGHLFFFLHAVSHFMNNAKAAINKIYIANQKDGATGNANCGEFERGTLISSFMDAKALSDAAVQALNVANSEMSNSFRGWFYQGSPPVDPTLPGTFAQFHYAPVSAVFNRTDFIDIDWSTTTDYRTAPVEPGSLVWFCEHGPPWASKDFCGMHGGGAIAVTMSEPTNNPAYLQYAMVAICPKFFTLPDFDAAGREWAIDKSLYQTSRGGTLLHEAQHINLLVSNEHWCTDVEGKVNGKLVKCYSPTLCWDNLGPYPSLQQKNAQNYRFFAQDALWAPQRVAPPPQANDGEFRLRKFGDKVTSDTTIDAFYIDPPLENFGKISSASSPAGKSSGSSQIENVTSSSSLSTTSQPASTTIPSTLSTSLSSRLQKPSSSYDISSSTSASPSIPSGSSLSSSSSAVISSSSTTESSTFTVSSTSTSSLSSFLSTTSFTSHRTKSLLPPPTSRGTETAENGQTVIAFIGEVVIGGAGGGYYNLDGVIFYLDPGQTETAGDSSNEPTTTLSPSTTSTTPQKVTTTPPSSITSSSSTISSYSSSSSGFPPRTFSDDWNNYQEDINIFQLDPTECSSLSIPCSIGPQISVTATTTTSSSTSTRTLPTTDAYEPTQYLGAYYPVIDNGTAAVYLWSITWTQANQSFQTPSTFIVNFQTSGTSLTGTMSGSIEEPETQTTFVAVTTMEFSADIDIHNEISNPQPGSGNFWNVTDPSNVWDNLPIGSFWLTFST